MNVFKSGFNKVSPNFKYSPLFPHELDNYQKSVMQFDVRKVFDSERRRWRNPNESASTERNLDIEVIYPFSVNEVKFNTGLNEDFIAVLEAAKNSDDNRNVDLIQPIVADYELNYR